jgi:hypothetical protein
MPNAAPFFSSSSTRLNQTLAWGCLALAVVLPLAALYGLWAASPGVGVQGLAMTLGQRVLAVVIGLLPVACMAYGLVRASQCFTGFARGAVFSLGTVQHLRGLAAGLLGAGLAGLLAPTLLGLLFTWGAPTGQHALAVSLGSQQLLMLLFAGIVWQIAHVMVRAREIADDNAQIV